MFLPISHHEVIITTEVANLAIVHDPVPPSSPPISPVSEDTATTPSLNQDDFDGILLHGDEFKTFLISVLFIFVFVFFHWSYVL